MTAKRSPTQIPIKLINFVEIFPDRVQVAAHNGEGRGAVGLAPEVRGLGRAVGIRVRFAGGS